MGLGLRCDSSLIRVPKPPARITTFIIFPIGHTGARRFDPPTESLAHQKALIQTIGSDYLGGDVDREMEGPALDRGAPIE
jgi:hypothetical protein